MTKGYQYRRTFHLRRITKDGTIEYYDTDSQSSGYPYWSKYHVGKAFHDELPEVDKLISGSYMSDDKTQVLEVVELIPKIVASIKPSELSDYAKRRAITVQEEIIAKAQAKLKEIQNGKF